jgi:hypothetical protein
MVPDKPVLTDKPLKFEFAPDTGLVTLTAYVGFGPPGSGAAIVHIPIQIMLTPESAHALRDDLPKIAEILDKASEGITKPRFVQ